LDDGAINPAMAGAMARGGGPSDTAHARGPRPRRRHPGAGRGGDRPPGGRGAGRAGAVAVHPASGDLFVASARSNTVGVISGRTYQPTGSIQEAADGPVALAIDATRQSLLIANGAATTIVAVSLDPRRWRAPALGEAAPLDGAAQAGRAVIPPRRG
jgi:DNA-binding beta-propeller fold protein YncE